jgi:hypothetical protein
MSYLRKSGTNTSSKDIFSGGADTVVSSTTKKWLRDGDSTSEGAGILRKSSTHPVQLPLFDDL